MAADRIVFGDDSYQIIGACFDPKIERERFVNQPLSRVSRIS